MLIKNQKIINIKIKEARVEDIDAIVNLNQKLFNYEYKNFDSTIDCDWPSKNKDYFKGAIENKDSIVLTAVSDGKIIGYLVGSIHKAENYRKIKELIEIDNTFIIEEYRRKGVGESLFNKFLEWAKKKGVKRVRAVATAKNKGSIDFYKKCGFLDYNLTLERDI